MPQCIQAITITTAADGPVEVVVPVISTEPCEHAFVLMPAEYAALMSNPFLLDVQGGLTVSAAILGVWAIAWGFRAAMDTLGSDGRSDE